MKNQSNSSHKIARRSFLFLAGAALSGAFEPFSAEATAGKPIRVERGTISKVPFYRTTIDLLNPHTMLAIGLANNHTLGNHQGVKGNEPFASMVKRYHASAIVNGAFFGKQAPFRVLGNLISGGQFLQYDPNESFGTTIGIGANNRPEMITTRTDGVPRWPRYWFSLTAGPRLLRNGQVWLAPQTEGFADPRVMGVAKRLAIGFPGSGKTLILVNFLKPISLYQEAKLMRAMGCREAMNLDGGSSLALSHQGKILVAPQRSLTNTIVVYDSRYPAPDFLRQARKEFQIANSKSRGLFEKGFRSGL